MTLQDKIPAELLEVSGKVTPLDYETRLRQKGHAKMRPPDLEGLFKALATEYVPKRVVHLPPEIVTINITDLIFGFGSCLLIVLLYAIVVIGLGLVLPYMDLSSFEVKMQLRPGATCTITGTQINSSTNSSNGDTTYYPTIYFNLLTSRNESYKTSEVQLVDYSTQANAQAYASDFQVDHSYSCWYNPANPTEASFFAPIIDVWDYIGLVVNGILFLVCGISTECPDHSWYCETLSPCR